MIKAKYDYITSVDGSEIRYLKIGTPGKPKVFMFHGLFMTHHMWLAYTFPRLLTHEFIIPDMRGHGKSDMFNHESEKCFELVCEDTYMIMQKELAPDEHYQIVAYSMGTVATLSVAEKYGLDNCDKYIHVDHSTNFSSDEHETSKIFQEFFDDFRTHVSLGNQLLRDDVLMYRNSSLHDLSPEEYEKAIDTFRIAVYETGITGLRYRLGDRIAEWLNPVMMFVSDFSNKFGNYMIWGHCYTENEKDFSPILEKIKCPCVMFVAGRNKMFCAKTQITNFLKYKPDAKIIKYENSGHDLMLSEPLRFYFDLWREIQ